MKILDPSLDMPPLFPMWKPADGNFRKLAKASVLLVTPASMVSAVSSTLLGTLNPIGHTELPSVLTSLHF